MMDGKIVRYNCSELFLLRKHFCYHCDAVLEKKKREVTVHSESEEAKNYDFSVADMHLYGNVKFITYFFECPNCKATYEISELKKLNKSRKKESADLNR